MLNNQQDKNNLYEIIDWCKESEFSINLNAELISVLLAIYLDQEKSDVEMTEVYLHDLIFSVGKSFGDKDLTPYNANIIINNLVKQKIINRFSLDEIDENSIYRLTPLGAGIASYYQRHRDFTNLALSLQLSMVSEEMVRTVEAAKEKGDMIHWRNKVYAPLKYSVAEIFDLIDYRQREIDEEKDRISNQIAELLRKDWQDSIISCKELLSNTGNTLHELQNTLSVTCDSLQKQLSLIYSILFNHIDLISISEVNDKDEYLKLLNILSELIESLQNKLDRIVSWGQKTIDLWSNFDRHVHKFIREVIDLDKNRVFAQRLRKSIDSYFDNSWYLTYANDDHFISLRDDDGQVLQVEVLEEFNPTLEYEIFDNSDEKIRESILEILNPYYKDKQEIKIHVLLENLLKKTPNDRHFDVARIFIEQAMSLGVSEGSIQGLYSQWYVVNDKGSEIQAVTIDKYK